MNEDLKALEAATKLRDYCFSHTACSDCIFGDINYSSFSQCELFTTPSHYLVNLVRKKYIEKTQEENA